ncbi:hypothetical protein L3Q82_021552 [Scortum barcoo]|uniref:Uncharacterized protein n=1 Tax=Scortum barcoo TaxID=214431 RepID=A0ACB8X446_9TELE|nr:hypothetical protein L3Q82_021552 [Scortum barcoo]
MYATRRVREQHVVLQQEMAPVQQQPRAEPKTLPREPSFPRTTTLHKALSIQNLTQIETPWENVTLNRCLFVAITILVLTSGFQRLNETLRGQRTAEEEEDIGLTVRQSSTLRRRGPQPEPETSLWDVVFWWLPDLDGEEDEDEDDEDVDGEVKRRKSKRGATTQASSRLRNRPLPDKKLMKQRDGKIKDRRAKKARDEEIKENKEKDQIEEPEEPVDYEDEDEGDEEAVPTKNKKLEEQKKKKKTQKG